VNALSKFTSWRTLSTTEAQRAALDELANASVAAAQKIKAACPTTISLTAPSRLAYMQQRIEAMIAAMAIVQPALDRFYSLLNDEQKVRLNALAEDQRRRSSATHSESCHAASNRRVYSGTHRRSPGKSDCVDRCAPISSSLTPRPNPHSTRCTVGAPHPAISCLDAFRTPAVRAWGWSRHPGVRKPAQERTPARGYGRLIRSERRSRTHPVLLQKVYEGAHLRQKQAVAQG
jgi:hypothetical protein